MMKTYNTRFVVGLVMIICCARLMEAQEMEDESEFNYVRGGPKGPERWGDLKPNWRTCKTGTKQSPINLPFIGSNAMPTSGTSDRINFFYNPSNATVKNRGHDIEVKWVEGVSKIRTDNVEYILKQCHWHTPSEHTIAGTRYAMELHLVHQNPNGGIAVVGLLYKLGGPDPFLAQFMDEIRAISDTSNEVNAGVVNPAQAIRRGRQNYYRYNGSLTTPPCTEGVIWTVDSEIRTVSQHQIDLLRRAVNDDSAQNARPLQPLNGRSIRLYKSNQQ